MYLDASRPLVYTQHYIHSKGKPWLVCCKYKKIQEHAGELFQESIRRERWGRRQVQPQTGTEFVKLGDIRAVSPMRSNLNMSSSSNQFWVDLPTRSCKFAEIVPCSL
jgi:hypothetical protein